MGDRGTGRGRGKEQATRPKQPRGRAAAKSKDDPARGKTEATGRPRRPSSPKKEPQRTAVQKKEPGEPKAAIANTITRKKKDKEPPLPDHRNLKPVVESLKLKMKEISPAADKVNTIVRIIISEVSQRDPIFQGMEKMSTGSYYEKLKISRPNEFDIMLNIPISDYGRIALKEFGTSGAFYTLSCKRDMPEFMEDFIDKDENISAKKILTRFRKLVSEVVSGMPVSIKRRNSSSPALTLIIENKPSNIDVDLVIALEIRQSWPVKTIDGMNIDCWLGKKVKRDFKFQPFYMVPKQFKDGNTVKGRYALSC
ncbi:cyclic GMP-AMP synthase-like isoform X2 [Pyxicephalus adspersus]|uniref:cyclic GMP-AMP synthase-like isoform X2 n=1 Tax=Pyxicephalus adspersus TaxID=30357 RepID=UPI003B5A62CD